MKARFRVWADTNESEDDCGWFDADNAAAAAEQYAAEDVDGGTDGVYSRGGHELCVRDEAGLLIRVRVTVDYSPTFYGEVLT
jgi:hypothetical protein